MQRGHSSPSEVMPVAIRTLVLSLAALTAALRHPVRFLRYAVLFKEYICGLRFGWSEVTPTSPTGRPPHGNSLDTFYVHGAHRGMTKWRHYLDAFLPHFTEIRAGRQKVRILEIGVFSGGSLQMYEEFFQGTQLEIVGVDLDPECRSFASERVVIEIGDQQDRSFWAGFVSRHPPFDIIIDDGGHSTEQQVASFESLFNHVSPGGLYVVEDVLSHTNRFPAFVAGLVAALNRRVDNDRATVQPTPFQQAVARIEIIPYAFLIRKHAPDMMPSEFSCPWVGTSWTEAARRVFEAGNAGRQPPVTADSP